MFIVIYASAGCIPDNEPTECDDLDSAAEYLLDQYLDEYEEEHGTRSGDYDIEDVKHLRVIASPRPGSLYAWSIVEVETLTDEQYVKAQGGKCPYCQSSEIEGGRIEAEGATATGEVSCNTCGKRWYDTYVLTGYMAVED